MKNMFKNSMIAVAIATLSGSVLAATATANFTVTATVNAACIVSVANVAFGVVTPAPTGDKTGTGNITSTCTNTTPYTLAISKGSGASMADRSMAGAAGNTDLLKYNLYTEVGATNIFGDGTGGTSVVNKTGTGTAQTTTIFGKLSLNQYVKADSYSDNLTVTLTY